MLIIDEIIAEEDDEVTAAAVTANEDDQITANEDDDDTVVRIPKGLVEESTEIIVEKFEKHRPFPPGVYPDNIENELYKRGIAGMSLVIKKMVDEIFKPMCIPAHMTDGIDFRRIKGVLLHGPSGTGKTLIARNLCKVILCATPTVIAGPALKDKYFGGSEKNIRELFDKARSDYRTYGAKSPLHVFVFDEFDSVAQKRSGDGMFENHNDGLVNQLLSMLDGVEQIPNILIIGTTNRPEVIDGALLRSGRIDLHLLVKYPEEAERLEILNLKAKGYGNKNLLHDDVNLAEIAEITDEFSGSDLEAIVSRVFIKTLQSAKYYKLSRLKNFDSLGRKMTRQDFLDVVEEMRVKKNLFG